MKVVDAKKIGGLSLVVLLLATIHVLISSTSPVVAEESAASTTSSDEVTAASAPNRFVVWADKTPGNWEIFLRRSINNGATWQAIKNLSNNPGSSERPDISVSGSNVYLVWVQANADGSTGINFLRSTDNAATFKPVVKLASIGTFGDSTPQVISWGSNVCVVWDQNGEIYIRCSTDNGVTLKTIINLSNNPGASTDEQIGVSGSNVYVMWLQRSADGKRTDVFIIRSTDNGGTWKSKVNLSNSGQVYYETPPDMAVSGSNIHVVWAHANPETGFLQVFIRSSTDGGATFKPVKILASSSNQHFDNPGVAASGSNVYVVYEKFFAPDEVSGASCGGPLKFELLFVASGNNGATWKPAVKLYEKFYSCAAGNESITPHILALGSNVYVAWREGGAAHGEGFFRASTDKGVTWGEIFSLLTAAGPGPGIVMAASGSSVYLVVWSQGEVYFFRSLDNGATLEPKKNLSNNPGRSTTPQIAV